MVRKIVLKVSLQKKETRRITAKDLTCFKRRLAHLPGLDMTTTIGSALSLMNGLVVITDMKMYIR